MKDLVRGIALLGVAEYVRNPKFRSTVNKGFEDVYKMAKPVVKPHIDKLMEVPENDIQSDTTTEVIDNA